MSGPYVMKTTVSTFDVGPSRLLRYSMILRLLQEAAGCQMDENGLTYEFLRERGMVYLLAKVSLSVTRLPAVSEELTLTTWFAGLRGAQFVRHFRISDEKGATLAEAESLWVIVDPDSHRILRPSAFTFFDRMPPYEQDRVNVTELKLPGGAGISEDAESETRLVRYSDIDCNGHMNNAIYADLFCDYYPGGFGGRTVRHLTISFEGEAKEGDAISIQADRTVEGMVRVVGKIGARRCFQAAALESAGESETV